MAERRMFAKSIVLSDVFLDMPMSARCLYFTLGMLADDDGFVGSPKSIMRQCGASQDDLQILLAKRYVLGFESGVIVIKHWRINNFLRNDRHTNTTYLEELATLSLDGKGSYTERDKNLPQLELEVVEEKEKKPLTEAQQKRHQAHKESSLPYCFDYKIRNAFVGKPCPICGCIMGYDNALVKPTIQHNLPISLGGKHEIDNISVICQSCNTSIQNKVETPPYNTEEVKEVWKVIGKVAGRDTEDRIGKDRIGKVSNYISPLPPLPEEVGDFEEVEETAAYQGVTAHDVSSEYQTRFNNIPGVIKCEKMTVKREMAISTILSHYSQSEIDKVFDKVAKSDFLTGINNINFKATFDWLFNMDNFAKVLEGNYDNRKDTPKKSGETDREWSEHDEELKRREEEFMADWEDNGELI